MALIADAIRQWDVNTAAEKLREALPKLRFGEADALKNAVAERVHQHSINGEEILQMMTDMQSPGKVLSEHETFKKLFNGLEHEFSNAQTAMRGVKCFAQVLVLKMILSESAAMGAAEERIFSRTVIPQEMRAMDYDVFYPIGESWLIECGQPEWHTYSSKVCRKGEGRKAVHGCYICPSGWVRIAIKAEGVDWSTWHKAYHGTAMKNVRSITEKGLVRPVTSLHGAAGAGGKKVIYCSPSIEYSAHWLYTATPVEMQAGSPAAAAAADDAPSSSLDLPIVQKDGTFAQYVFEVRVKSDAYRVQGNTLGKSLWEDWGIEFDHKVSSRQLEWIVENEEDIVVTGVMLRPLVMHPKEYNALRLASMKKHVGWDEKKEPPRPTRPRNYGGVEAGATVAWEWNGNGSDQNTLTYSDGAKWIRYSDEISEVIESAYQDYQRFAFLGKPEGAPGPYFIDFGSECQHEDFGWGESLPHGPEQRRADADKEQGWRRRAVRRVRK